MAHAPQAPQHERAPSHAELAEARRRYEALRSRKAVRAALAVAGLGRRVQQLVGRRAPPAQAPADPPAPPSIATPPPGDVPQLRAAEATAADVAHCWPLGHFYSPVPDTVALAGEEGRIWPVTPRETPGIDWRDNEQVALVRDVFALQPPLGFPTAATGDLTEYHTANAFFSRLDAWALQAMLRWLRPARVIEVGSGWSSLVTARVNREHFGGEIDVTCIEPYPADYLAGGAPPGITRMDTTRVQDVAVERFLELCADDVLFIDSSHVIKTGSDVQYLYHEVLPRLRPGVVVHIHDIFLPWDYPQEWVLSGRGWNEQYLLQSFLAFNDAFEILLGIAWMNAMHRDLLADAVGDFAEIGRDGGGSFWMRRAS